MLVLGALELSDRVQTIGAFAGFAAILGLGVLSLLYFGQARELKRLRDWAGRAPERAAELQAQAATTAGEVRRVTAQPVGARPPAATTAARPGTPPAATPAGAAGAGAAAGATAAGVASGPQGPATPGGKPPGPAPGAPAAPAPGTPGGPATPGQKPAAAPANGAAQDGTDQPTVVVPGPGATPGQPGPPGAAGSPPSPGTPGAPPAATPAGAAASPAGTPPRPPIPVAGEQESGEIAMPLRRVSASATTVPPAPPPSRVRAAMSGDDGDEGSDGGGGRGGIAAVIGGIAAVLVVGVLVATQLFGGDDAPPEQNTIADTVPGQVAPDEAPEQTTTTTEAPEVVRGNVTVAVLNGTTVAGLARSAATKIETEGYKIGQVVNAADQSRPSTVVQFVEGSRDAALDVARVIGLPASSVQAMDQGTRVLAGDEAAVVVTVGADQSG